MGGVGAGEALSWDDAGNDKSSKNAIAAEWIVSLRILNLFPTGRTLRPLPVTSLRFLCAPSRPSPLSLLHFSRSFRSKDFFHRRRLMPCAGSLRSVLTPAAHRPCQPLSRRRQNTTC